MSGGESKGTWVSGAAWSASDRPEGKLESVALHSPLLLSRVVLEEVVKQWRVPAFSKGELADLPTLVGGHRSPPCSVSVHPMGSLHGANPPSSFFVLCTPPWMLLTWGNGWGLKARWGEKAPISSHHLWPVLLFPSRRSRGEQMSRQMIPICLMVLQLPNARLLAQRSWCLRHLQVHL